MKNEIILEQDEDDEEYEQQEEKQRNERKERMKRMQQLIDEDDEQDVNQQKTESYITNEYIQELENEFYPDYQESLPLLSSSIKLRPMNELQLAQIYVDDSILLKQRRFLMVRFQILRESARQLIGATIFQILLLIIIILNSVCLALEVDSFQLIFMILYSIEALLKMLANGVIQKKDSYFRDIWNVLDFIILLFQYLPYIYLIDFNFNALRTIRILRSLDSGQSIPALKIILTSLFQSIYQLKDALIVLLFSYSIFAIVGLLLFGGALKKRCVNLEDGISISDEVCSSCSNEFSCVKQLANPQQNLINFDTFGWALVQVYICTLLERWSDILDYTIDAFNDYVIIYFFLVVLVGGFFLVNLTLAIIKLNFSNNQKPIVEQVVESSYDYWELRLMGIYEPPKKPIRVKNDNVFTFRERTQRRQTTFKSKRKTTTIENQPIKIEPIKFANHFSQPFVKQEKKFMGIYGMGKKLRPLPNGKTPRNSNQLSINFEKKGFSLSPINKDINNTNNYNESFSINYSPDVKFNQNFFNSSSMLKSPIMNQNKSPRNISSKLIPNQKLESFTGSPKSQFALKRKSILKNTMISQADSDIVLANDLKMLSQNAQKSQKTITLVTPKESEEQNLEFLSNNGFVTPSNNFLPVVARLPLQHGTYVQGQEIRMISDIKQRSFNIRNKLIENIKNDISILDKSENSIINSIPSDQVEQELVDLGIIEAVENRKKQRENQQNVSNPKIIRKRRSKATRKTMKRSTYLSKTFNSNTDERYQQLKTKLFKTKFYKEVCYLQYKSTSEFDVLELTQNKQKQQDIKDNEAIIRKIRKQIKYVFSNESTQLIKFKSTGKINMTTTAHNKSQTEKKSQKQVKFQDEEEHKEHRKMILKNHNFTFQEAQLLIRKEIQAVEMEQYPQVEIQYDLKDLLRYLTYDQVRITTSTNYQEYVQLMHESNQTTELVQQSSIEDIIPMNDFVDEKTVNQMNKIIEALNYSFSQVQIWLPGVLGILKMTRIKLEYFIGSQIFMRIINTCVAFNTIILALDGLVSNDTLLQNFNLAFTIVFTIELVLKLMSLGMKRYLQDKFNIFDAFIVAISLYEISINIDTKGKSSFSALRAVRVLRALRVLRISKLIRSLKFMAFLLQVLGNAFEQIMWMFLLMLFFQYTFTILGLSLFGGLVSDDEYRLTFNSFVLSFETVFSLFTVSNWSDILYSLFLSDANNIVVFLYLVVWIATGNYIFLNLFLAVLLENFEQEYRRDKDQIDSNIIIGKDQIFDSAISSKPQFQSSRKSSKSSLQDEMEEYQKLQTSKFIYFTERGIAEEALMVLSQENLFRKICYRCVKDKKFDAFILALIFVSSVKLILDTYQLGPEYNVISTWLDITMVICFGIEAVFKIVAYGFIGDELSYLRNSWNILDFIILIGSIIDVSFSSIDLSFIKILRLFRTLRPLRFISHNRSMKIIVSALLQSGDGILNVAIVIILIWTMFAIIGINFAKGRLYYCDMDDSLMHYVTQEECKGIWRIYDSNFENIFSGMLTLFCLSTLGDWPDQLLFYVDGTDRGLVKNNAPEFFLFFFSFILIGSILLNNLFIGVILVNFHIAEEKARDPSLTLAQVQWIDTQKLIIEARPDMSLYYYPKNSFQVLFFKIVKFKYFDLAISICIIINVVVMGMYMDDGNPTYLYAIDQINFAISVVFVTEAILKIVAFNPLSYFKVTWNQFDFIIVCISIIDFVTNESGLGIGKEFRILRAIRLLRLVRQFKGLKKLIDTAIFSIPAIINAAALYFLIHSIFSVLGVFLFSDIRSGKIISDQNNFKDFHHSFILLFLSQTGLDWNRIMYDTMNKGSYYNALFWVAFILIQNFVMLNLFLLIVLDQYDINYFHEDNPLNKFDEYQNRILHSWTKLSLNGEVIHQNKMTDIILSLPKPLGLDLGLTIIKGVEDWKHTNPYHTPAEVQQLKQNIKADQIKNALFKLMDMGLMSDQYGNIPYNLVLFSLIREGYIDQLEINVTEEGGRKLMIREMETRTVIEEEYGADLDQEVNPLVTYLYTLTCFRALKRYVETSKNVIQENGVSFVAQTDSSMEFEEDVENDYLSRDEYEKPDYEEVYFVEIPHNDQIYNCEKYRIQIAQSEQSEDEINELQIVDFNKYLGD